MERVYHSIKGEFNKIAVCSKCNRNATQTRMSYVCVDIVDKKPFVCDECRAGMAKR